MSLGFVVHSLKSVCHGSAEYLVTSPGCRPAAKSLSWLSGFSTLKV
jgi:hypothetical protein